MSDSSARYWRTRIDGGEVVVPTSADPATLREIASLDDGKPLSDSTLAAGVQMANEVALDSEKLRFGFYRLGPSSKHFWLPITFLVMPDGRWQRVFLEHLTCGTCGWQGLTANPLLADLYATLPGYWDLQREAAKLPKLSCPRCGNELPRHPIWIDPAAL